MSLLGSDSTETAAETAKQAEENQTGERPPKTQSTSFKLARALFGGVMAFMAVENLRDLEGTVEYAESQGAPMAEESVPLLSGSLLFGGLGLTVWKLPRLAAGAVATFFVGITPVMHDFWTRDDEQERQQQLIHFLKNVALFGGALAFLRVAEDDRE